MKTQKNFATASGETYERAFGDNGILSQGSRSEDFSVSHDFIEQIASVSRIDGQQPDEETLGRECYSFSERENVAFMLTKSYAENLAKKIGIQLNIETDPIGNLYIRVSGSREEGQQEKFKTRIAYSHLDSVANGGKYDGVAGVASGMETLQKVLHYKKEGKLLNSFCLTIFRSEESSPHNGLACLGSSIATGKIGREKLESIIYKEKNGESISLKDHLEFSLSRHFQRVEESEDDEWWNWFCQTHDIVKENYSQGDLREKICKSVENPNISEEAFKKAFELHIEQGTLIANTKVDGKQAQFGIVSGGIGGAKRYKTLEPIPVEIAENLHKEYESYNFVVEGFSDHTGSTPNNLELESAEYRRDANIATNLFLEAFLEEDFGELIASNAENDEGYTKVPYKQKVCLAIMKTKKQEFNTFIEEQKRVLENKNKVVMSEGTYRSSHTDVKTITKNTAKEIVGSLLGVSRKASEAFQIQKRESPIEKKFGSTRATLTNVHLSAEGLNFALDIREINTEDVRKLMDGISYELQNILPHGIEGLQKVSEKKHQKISNDIRDRLIKVADLLGYRYILLPSMPGHDTDRLAAAGLDTGMVFVGQEDGVSHNPKEKMQKKYYNPASNVVMNTVLAELV